MMRMKKAILRIIDSMLDHIGLYSMLIGAVGTVVFYVIPFGRMRIVPHIITYSSCNLALIGFIFSILLGLRGGEIHEKLSKRFPKKLKQIYRTVYKITVASSVCALLAMLICAIDVWQIWMKWILSYALCSIFIYMVIGTLLIFNVLIELLIKDEK